jgi:ABC-type lipoprotein release transport system permease subunit
VARQIEIDRRIDDPYLHPDPDIYVVQPNDSTWARSLVFRGADAVMLAVAVRRALQTAEPRIGFSSAEPWLRHFEQQVASSAFTAWLFATFGLFAVTLCGIGIYGVLAYSVARRLREFAVRISLGARSRHVVRQVVHDAAVMALAGIAVGAFIALGAALFVGLVGPRTNYGLAWSLLAAESVLVLTAVIAAIDPVRRAVKADLVELLRAN